MGIVAALPAGHQRDFAGAADREGRRRRSAVRASAERSVRGVAAGLQSVLPFAVTMEDVPGIVRGLASPDCPRRAVEPGELGADGEAAGVYLRAGLSGDEDTGGGQQSHSGWHDQRRDRPVLDPLSKDPRRTDRFVLPAGDQPNAAVHPGRPAQLRRNRTAVPSVFAAAAADLPENHEGNRRSCGCFPRHNSVQAGRSGQCWPAASRGRRWQHDAKH
uniref:(northern house mosquito) hypothetical protein n=1 Tax=Culex pipiens TaxID=7175 RepID=A0A8D8NX38_CULPI